MAATLDDTINRRTYGPVAWLLSRQTFWVFVATVLACLLLSLVTDTFATKQNIFNVTRNFSFIAIAALGVTVVIITGGIDLSVGSVMGLSAIILGITMNAGQSIWIGIGCAVWISARTAQSEYSSVPSSQIDQIALSLLPTMPVFVRVHVASFCGWSFSSSKLFQSVGLPSRSAGNPGGTARSLIRSSIAVVPVGLDRRHAAPQAWRLATVDPMVWDRPGRSRHGGITDSAGGSRS